MKERLIQVIGFVISTVGWFFVCCSVGMDYWRTSYIGGQGGSWIIKAAWYWSTLWRECYIDSSDVSSCKDYDTMWTVSPETRTEQGRIKAVRSLLLVGMSLGFLAAIFSFIGMDCTYIGGQQKIKDKLLLVGTVLHFTGGLSSLSSFCVYTSTLGSIIFTRMEGRFIRYYIGVPVYFGLIGSSCIITGSVLYAVTSYRLFKNRETDISASRNYISPKIDRAQKKGQTYYSNDEASALSWSSWQSSRQVSRSSIIMSDIDTFV